MTPPDDRSGGYRDSALRPYVLTKGRARPSRNTISVDTLLIATDPPPPLPVSAGRQERALLAMCRGLLSLVEVAARLELPVSVVRVLASDLVDSGHLTARAGSPRSAQLPRDLLQEVLNGLRAL
ncbi:DUF742 domain-containing protein [Plantactinospora endophytica]|uniref:DUF742 domain-containing protein n=1 Tax=Plantactinospora endophytica TaxID=673535 RepID=A0ABQ4DS70_9ACTN|nr:DUF742 domain-containing protein [Plantactinospora endophytica]GIG85297.1 hypothetical protein Pen02_02330 [Plantactinospora endophytica]